MRRAITSERAPAAVGPYSQAIEADGFIYLSGQIALDAASGAIVPGGIAKETLQVVANMTAVLEAAGLGLEHVVKTTIYLVDLNDFATVNEIYGAAFHPPFPARATVGVAALPKGAKVEIEAVARRS